MSPHDYIFGRCFQARRALFETNGIARRRTPAYTPPGQQGRARRAIGNEGENEYQERDRIGVRVAGGDSGGCIPPAGPEEGGGGCLTAPKGQRPGRAKT